MEKAKTNVDRAAELTCREAGHRGGVSTLARRGIWHFSRIGARGQKAFAQRYTAADRSNWGKLGGRPRRHRLNLGEEGKSQQGGMGSPPDHSPPPPDTMQSGHLLAAARPTEPEM